MDEDTQLVLSGEWDRRWITPGEERALNKKFGVERVAAMTTDELRATSERLSSKIGVRMAHGI